MKIKGLWFFGISGSGKSFLSKFLKKKIKNSILLDGDDVRKFISFDLSYSIYDRVIQTKRMLGFAEICIKNRLFPIISTVYLNKRVYLNAKKRGILVRYPSKKTKDIIYDETAVFTCSLIFLKG